LSGEYISITKESAVAIYTDDVCSTAGKWLFASHGWLPTSLLGSISSHINDRLVSHVKTKFK